MNHPSSMRRAFSLVEVLIAAVLLVVCLVPVLTFSQRGIVESGAIQEDLLAHRLLMDMSERFKASTPEELQRFAADPTLLRRDNLLLPLAKMREIAAADGEARGGGRGDGAGRRWRRQFTRRLYFTQDVDGQAGLHKVTFEVTCESKHRGPMKATLSRVIHYH